MGKKRLVSLFYCQNCGNESPKWMGKCSYCHEWNSIVEKKITEEQHSIGTTKLPTPQVVKLAEVITDDTARIQFQDSEFNRIMGGGVMAGSITLVAGEPGIGKSTLFLQLGLHEKKKRFLSAVKKVHNKLKNELID